MDGKEQKQWSKPSVEKREQFLKQMVELSKRVSKSEFEIIDAKSGKIIVKLGEKINFVTAQKLAKEGLKEIYVANPSLYGKFIQKVKLLMKYGMDYIFV